MRPTDLVRLASELIGAAEEKGLVLRLVGGVAIYARCPSIESHPTLQRDYEDIDAIASPDSWNALPSLMEGQGWTPKWSGADKLAFSREGIVLDIRNGRLVEDYRLDFSARIKAVPLTLPLADLLLVKLARVNFREKDIQDATALLVDHRVTSGGDEEHEINREYLYRVTNREYRLWSTVFQNTVTLEKVFDRYLEPEEAQLAWRRIELIQEVLDGKPHAASWWLQRIAKMDLRH